ncbi:hypothetical protein [Peribacillus sp. NPDC058075]|uniref:hypothetical protein n=1 Tax=unclassified Peribacillus TaxID=2675266 RepID=UPI0036DF67FE
MGKLISEWELTKGEVCPNALYIGCGAPWQCFGIMGVGWCYKEQETSFLYCSVDENDIEHDVK